MTGNLIEVTMRRGVRGMSAAQVRRVVADTLAAEKAKKRQVSVLLTGNREIRRINLSFLKHDYATDVISFGAGVHGAFHCPGRRAASKGLRPGEKNYLGDIVVSAEMAKSFSKKLRIPYPQELSRYLVHGTLHLLGYEDRSKKDRIKMRRRQESILTGLFRDLAPAKLS